MENTASSFPTVVVDTAPDAAVEWSASVVDRGTLPSRSPCLRLRARYDPRALGGRLRLTRMDPQGTNPHILLLFGSISPEGLDPTEVLVEREWEFSGGRLQWVQIVGLGAVPLLAVNE